MSRLPLQPRSALPIHCLVAVGGLAALSWESIWQLQASLALGVSAIGTALTLAATMAGMTAGALAMGAWLDRRPQLERPLRLYATLECVVGVSGLLMLPGFRALESLDVAVYAATPSLASLLHGLGVGLLLAPATCAMGATVPVFQLIARRHRTSISMLYAINTAGAALGVLLLPFAVMPSLGVLRTCLLLAALNFSVFGLAWMLPSASQPAPHAPAGVDASRRPPVGFSYPVALVVVSVTGFVTFGLEVAWFRALRSAFWSTSSTFAMMLSAVLIALAAGARLVPWLRSRGTTPGSLLAVSGGLILLSTPLVERMDLAIKLDGPYPVVLSIWFLLSLVAIGPPIACLATALPWCLEDHHEPRMTGQLYGLNALGSVAGSLVAAWGMLPLFGFAMSAWILGVAVLGCAFWTSPERRPRILIATGLCLGVAAFSSSSPGRDRLQNELDFAGHHVLALEEGPDFTTSVVQTPEGVRHLLIDGFVATSDHEVGTSYMYWMGSLPALLHPKPETGLVIAFGTGQTANGLRREGLGHIDVVDISPSVFELARFFEANEQVLGDPVVHPIVMDGRAWLRRSDRQYDVITLEPMPPNFAGVNALYSREFYEIAASRLTRLGVLAQWLPIHMLSPEHASAIAAAFTAVFRDSVLWFDPTGGTGILLGRRGGAMRPLGESWPGFRRDARPRPLTPEAVRQSVWLDTPRLALYARGGTVVTDDNQLLQWGQLKPAPTSRRATELNLENATILARFAGRPPFSIQRAQPKVHAASKGKP